MTYQLIRLRAFVIAGALALTPFANARAQTDPPTIQREFRGAWVASVANIDWPSRPGLSTWEQQAELIGILNRCVALNFNAVILQVRPAADALYDSPYEPWSAYLTGLEGRAPAPYYDPLTFAIAEAHKRGLELHAWFNPYRARHASARGSAAQTHLSNTRPELVRTYGRTLSGRVFATCRAANGPRADEWRARNGLNQACSSMLARCASSIQKASGS